MKIKRLSSFLHRAVTTTETDTEIHWDFRLFRLSKKWCHSEPVRTLAWESLGFSNIFVKKVTFYHCLGDCHTSDIGHWFAMTVF